MAIGSATRGIEISDSYRLDAVRVHLVEVEDAAWFALEVILDVRPIPESLKIPLREFGDLDGDGIGDLAVGHGLTATGALDVVRRGCCVQGPARNL